MMQTPPPTGARLIGRRSFRAMIGSKPTACRYKRTAYSDGMLPSRRTGHPQERQERPISVKAGFLRSLNSAPFSESHWGITISDKVADLSHQESVT